LYFEQDKPTQNTPYLFEPLAQVAAAFRYADEQDVTGKEKRFRGYSSREPVMILSEFIPKDSYVLFPNSKDVIAKKFNISMIHLFVSYLAGNFTLIVEA
jgi:hypothetical protein